MHSFFTVKTCGPLIKGVKIIRWGPFFVHGQAPTGSSNPTIMSLCGLNRNMCIRSLLGNILCIRVSLYQGSSQGLSLERTFYQDMRPLMINASPLY